MTHNKKIKNYLKKQQQKHYESHKKSCADTAQWMLIFGYIPTEKEKIKFYEDLNKEAEEYKKQFNK